LAPITRLVIFATPFIENMALALKELLNAELQIKDVQIQLRAVTNTDIIQCNEEPGTYFFICCPHKLLSANTAPSHQPSNWTSSLPQNKYFLYQLEQLDKTPQANSTPPPGSVAHAQANSPPPPGSVAHAQYMNPYILGLMKNARHTFDYSAVNLPYYPTELKDLNKVSILVPPIRGHPQRGHPVNPDCAMAGRGGRRSHEDGVSPCAVGVDGVSPLCPRKYIDILFCGTMNARREKILNGLRLAGLNVVQFTGIFGAELSDYIKTTSVFLNLHYADSEILETCRLHEALGFLDTHIVSETVQNKSEMAPYLDRVKFVERDNLKELIREIKRLLAPEEKAEYSALDEINIKTAAELKRVFMEEAAAEGDIFINILLRTTYRPSYFPKCIESILNQTYKNIRIICCYDDVQCLE
jgi:hypothetical protein